MAKSLGRGHGIAAKLAVDTHMSLLADEDFIKQQEAIDAARLKRLASWPTAGEEPLAPISGDAGGWRGRRASQAGGTEPDFLLHL